MRITIVITIVHIAKATIAINSFMTILGSELYFKIQKSILLANTILG